MLTEWEKKREGLAGWSQMKGVIFVCILFSRKYDASTASCDVLKSVSSVLS